MPRQAPRIGERFDLTFLETSGTFKFQFATEQMRTFTMTTSDGMFQNIFRTSPLRESSMHEMRTAGIWFSDIARISGFPSASSASAAYIRYCRSVGIEPQVRAENRRVQQIRESATSARPEFLNREHFTGEFNDFGFGVEIEQVGLTLRSLVNITSRLGLPTNMETRYTHEDPTRWKAVPDGSLRGRVTGECVSRILRGHDGLVELRSVLLAMKQAGSKTNASCGQHIHIGIEPFNLRTQAMVIRAHATFQHVFDLLVNPLRRNHRDYARHTEWNFAMHNAKSFENGDQHNANMAKYRSLNINKYGEYGTFEFRAFHGSLNPRHTVAWLQLHFDFFSFIEKVANATTEPTNRVLNLEGDAMADLATRMPRTMALLAGFSREGHYATESPWMQETGVGRQSNTVSNITRADRSAEWRADNPMFGASFQQTVAHDDMQLNTLAKWALPVLQEWVSDTSFVGNETVRMVLKELVAKQFPMLHPDTLVERAYVTEAIAPIAEQV